MPRLAGRLREPISLRLHSSTATVLPRKTSRSRRRVSDKTDCCQRCPTGRGKLVGRNCVMNGQAGKKESRQGDQAASTSDRVNKACKKKKRADYQIGPHTVDSSLHSLLCGYINKSHCTATAPEKLYARLHANKLQIQIRPPCSE